MLYTERPRFASIARFGEHRGSRFSGKAGTLQLDLESLTFTLGYSGAKRVALDTLIDQEISPLFLWVCTRDAFTAREEKHVLGREVEQGRSCVLAGRVDRGRKYFLRGAIIYTDVKIVLRKIFRDEFGQDLLLYRRFIQPDHQPAKRLGHLHHWHHRSVAFGPLDDY